MIASDWLTERARAHPGRLAAVDADGSSLTFAELDAAVERAAAELGLSEWEGPVAIELPVGLDQALAVHACIRYGRCLQIVRPGLPESAREPLVSDALVVGPGSLDSIGAADGDPPSRPAAPAASQDLPLARVFTSGTSGMPRPVLLTRANFFWSAIGSALNLGLDPADRWLCCLPTDHVGGLSIVTRSLIYGTCAELHPGFELDRVGQALESGRISIVSLVPTQLGRLLAAGYRLDRPRALLLGGGPVPPDLLEQATAAGARVFQTYGMTETCSQVCTLPPDAPAAKAGSAGVPLPGVGVRIDDGEIVVSGPTVAPASLTDGELRTGDLGSLDPDGYLWVDGRADDLIISGGENVMPAEVEAVLLGHPAVAEAGVYGAESAEWGQEVRAVVVLGGALPDMSDLEAHCRAQLPPAKRPKSIEVRERLPRTRSGKLRRGALA